MIVELQSKRLYYRLELKHKITVIQSDSGRGKSEFTRCLDLSPAIYKRRCSDNRYVLRVITEDNWESSLSTFIAANDFNIFICDDVDYILSQTFINLVKSDMRNYYIIINRFVSIGLSSLNQLPLAVDSICEFNTSGKKHWIESKHTLSSVRQSGYDVVVTEDAKSGLQFLRAYNKDVSTTSGKDRVIPFFVYNQSYLRDKRVFLFIDMSGCGASFEKLLKTIDRLHLSVTIMPEYLSFEYCLLSSNFFKYDFDSISNDEIARYFSDERLYEGIISEITRGQPYVYNAETDKPSLNPCYIIDCCKRTNRKSACDRGISGRKLDELFKGTVFEVLFRFIRSSSLQKLSCPKDFKA